MAHATSSLTAPTSFISSADTLRAVTLASLEYVIKPPWNTFDDPGISVRQALKSPPEHDSAVAIVNDED